MNTVQRLPYPGLRAFNRDESDLFFGRETAVQAMLDKLAHTRFLAILGTSGSGKSSLVRTGLFDALELGFMSAAGSRWKIIDTHPGEQALKNLATRLMADDDTADPLSIDLLSSFLSRGPKSLIAWCQDGHLPPGHNLLILVDQFEELFRYSDYAAREEAEAFVALLLTSAAADLPIYIAITLRSEYLSACTLLPGLTERINSGLYLTPRMSRDECRLAIVGPASVMGFSVEAALVNRLLNDLEEFSSWDETTDPSADQMQRLSRRADQLPLMQHLLNRLWLRATSQDQSKPSPTAHESALTPALSQRERGPESGGSWTPVGAGIAPKSLPQEEELLRRDHHQSSAVILTLDDYNDLGGLQNALNEHARQVIERIPAQQRHVIPTVFRALVDGASPAFAVRRPCPLRELVELTGDADAVRAVVDAFRSSDCHFLRPAAPAALHEHTLIDLSHESLIRQWQDLTEWTEQEAASAAIYRRLQENALLHQQNRYGFYRTPELENALDWQAKNAPSAAWAKRYGEHYALAMAFLAGSAREQQRIKQREAAQAKFKLRVALGVSLLALILSAWAMVERHRAQDTEQQRVVELFQSRLTHGALLAKSDDYAAAKRVLAETQALDAQVNPRLRHARNLLHSYAQIRGGEAEQVYEGAGYPLLSVAISPDGQLLAAGGEHGTLVLFDAHSGKLVQRLAGHVTEGRAAETAVSSVAFSPDGQQLISAGMDKKILIWQRQADDLHAAKLFVLHQQLSAADKVKAISLSPDGKLLASGGNDKAVTLWDLRSGQKLNTFSGHTGGISSRGLAFSPDGRYLASSSGDNTARIWRLSDGSAVQVLRGHSDQVNQLSFSADSAQLATSSSDKTLRLWDVATGEMLRVFSGHSNSVWALSWLGESLISGSDDRSLRLWDSRSGVNLRLWQGHEAGVSALALYGGTAWSASKDGTLRRWALTLPYQQTLALPAEPASAAILPSLVQVAVGFADGALAVYDRLKSEPLWQTPAAHGGHIARLTMSHGGSLLASGSFDNTAKLWQIQTSATGLELRETAAFSGHKNFIHALAFSRDDQTLATAGYDGQIGLFSVDTSQPAVFIPAAHEGTVASVEFDTSGQHLLSSGNKDRHLKLWDLSRRPPAALDFPQAKDNLLWASLSPDGRTLIGTGRGSLASVYDRLNSQPLAHLTGHENAVFRAAYAPDSGQIATVSADRTVKLWSLELGKELFSLALPTEFILPSPLWDFDFRCVTEQCLIAVPLVRGTLQLYRLGYEQPLIADADEQKRQQRVLWQQYQDSADQQLQTQALQAAAQTLREQDEIAQRFHAQFPTAPETAAFDTHRDCQQQQLQHLLTPNSPAPSAACLIRLNHATSAAQLNRLGNAFYDQKQYPQAQAVFAEALNQFPADLSLLSNDAELALVQNDLPRLQQRLDTLRTLYRQKDGLYRDEFPAIIAFIRYLSAPEQTPDALLAVIEQTDQAVSYTWNFSTMQPALDRQTPRRQKTAALFIDFFQKRIDRATLKTRLK